MPMRIVRSEATKKIALIRPPFGKSKKWLISVGLLVGVTQRLQPPRRASKSSHFLTSKFGHNIVTPP